MAPHGGPMGPRGFLTEEEKQSRPKVTKELLRRILSYLKPYILQFVFVFISILAAAVLGLLPSIVTGKIVDTALAGSDLKLLIKLLLIAFAAMTASQVVGVIESYINAWISQRIIFDMKNEMYTHLQRMPHAFFTAEKQGEILTRMENDISGVSQVISRTLASVVSNVATVVTTVTALFSMSWQLAIVGIAVVPLLMLPTRKAGVTRWKLAAEGQKKRDELNQIVEETLSVSGSLLVKLFAKEKYENERFRAANEEVTRYALKEERSGKWLHVFFGMFSQIGPLLIYFAGGYFIITKTDTALTVGTITAAVALTNRLYGPILSLLNMQVDFTRSLALFSRIFEYLDRKETIVSSPDAVKPDIAAADIAFEHVNFAYDEGSPILKDITFTVPHGKAYAVVGPSGSGKSTLVNLIPRLYDAADGSVKIGGTDVRDIDLAYLRENIGTVSQDTYLFNGTIRENLIYAKENATEEQIVAACKVANIHDFIAGQPQGYDTLVGNRGLKLSGGEKQRISIARVMLKDPHILILDEATSSLDSISENSIQQALEEVMRERTSIVIAHRLSTILLSDRIIVIAGGRIVQSGSHEELLEEGGVYKELYETQFSKVLQTVQNRGAENAEKDFYFRS